MSAYSDLIITATGASDDDVAIIENIMSEETVHNMLDGQTTRHALDRFFKQAFSPT